MESKRLLMIIHLQIPLIFMNRPLDAFDSKPMVLSVWFIGNQSIIGT